MQLWRNPCEHEECADWCRLTLTDVLSSSAVADDAFLAYLFGVLIRGDDWESEQLTQRVLLSQPRQVAMSLLFSLSCDFFRTCTAWRTQKDKQILWKLKESLQADREKSEGNENVQNIFHLGLSFNWRKAQQTFYHRRALQTNSPLVQQACWKDSSLQSNRESNKSSWLLIYLIRWWTT